MNEKSKDLEKRKYLKLVLIFKWNIKEKMIDFLNYQNYISNYSYKLKISSLKYKNDLVLHLKIEINDFLRRKISGPRLVMGGSWWVTKTMTQKKWVIGWVSLLWVILLISHYNMYRSTKPHLPSYIICTVFTWKHRILRICIKSNNQISFEAS